MYNEGHIATTTFNEGNGEESFGDFTVRDLE